MEGSTLPPLTFLVIDSLVESFTAREIPASITQDPELFLPEDRKQHQIK